MSEHALELGDIVKVSSPHINDTFYINYVDDNEMELINVATTEYLIVDMKEINMSFVVLDRAAKKGFARQNGLEKNVWVEIDFHGDAKLSVTAEIVDLIEDCIVLKTYRPKDITLYIDFEYKGTKHLLIDRICIRDRPKSLEQNEAESEANEANEVQNEVQNEANEANEANEVQNEANEVEADVFDAEFDIDAFDLDDREFLAKPITKRNVRYNLDVQLNHLLETMMARVPENQKRAPRALRSCRDSVNYANSIQTSIPATKKLCGTYQNQRIRWWILSTPK